MKTATHGSPALDADAAPRELPSRQLAKNRAALAILQAELKSERERAEIHARAISEQDMSDPCA